MPVATLFLFIPRRFVVYLMIDEQTNPFFILLLPDIHSNSRGIMPTPLIDSNKLRLHLPYFSLLLPLFSIKGKQSLSLPARESILHYYSVPNIIT